MAPQPLLKFMEEVLEKGEQEYFPSEAELQKVRWR
jgi:hypothetical protein